MAAARTCLLRWSALLLAPCLSGWSPALAATACPIDHPEKIGIGAWPVRGEPRMLADIGRAGATWFYTWQADLRRKTRRFIPMVKAGKDVPQVTAYGSDVVLAFNEPDQATQANMQVNLALAYWPTLMAARKRLGSPAVSFGQELGSRSWLGRFMGEARKRRYRVDFIAVHYYASKPDIGRFRSHLRRIFNRYRRPIWVTEWALADWSRPGRFSAYEQARFLWAGANMLDDLPFVERHAWFGLYEGLDGWKLNSGLLSAKGEMTPVGRTFKVLKCGRS